MRRTILILSLVLFAALQSGCATRTGQGAALPQQKIKIIAASPRAYSIRVPTEDEKYVEAPASSDGRVEFYVPVVPRYGTPYLFGKVQAGWPKPAEEHRVIRLMRGGKVIHLLSPGEIALLPRDPDGYHKLRIWEEGETREVEGTTGGGSAAVAATTSRVSLTQQ